MPREPIVREKGSEPARKPPVDPRVANYQLVPAAAKELEPVRNAAEKLREGIIKE